MLLSTILRWLALLSFVLNLWQWFVARRFPLHQRLATPGMDEVEAGSVPATKLHPPKPPGVTLLKPLKGADAETDACLRSWFKQDYDGDIQILFGVASADDPVCPIVRRLLAEFPRTNAELVICGPLGGTNLKVAKLAQLEPKAAHQLLVVSDADVRVPSDFLTNALPLLDSPKVGLVNCFYELANPGTAALQWEAVAINADFWSQVLQSKSLKPLDFALGAVMATRRQQLNEIGGFAALADCLADDYQLGNRIARRGYRIELCPVVVECWTEPMSWGQVWRHQLRWARTIRVCQPLPYFFSILSNATLWPLLWLAAHPGLRELTFAGCFWLARLGTALNLQQLLTGTPARLSTAWLIPLKDLLQAGIWFLAFLGNRVEWRGRSMRLRRDGTLAEA